MRPAIIFLDDGGVINDNDRRAQEWQRLVGEFLAPPLGGEPVAWAEANRIVFERQWRRYEVWAQENSPTNHSYYFDFFAQRTERVRWLQEMSEHFGIRAPADDECYRLAIETEDYVLPRVRSAFPGAVEAVRVLHTQGHRLSTASGASSRDLERYLAGMGVRDCFSDRLYGPDLIHTPKAGTEFYRRLFADANVQPAQALVVDDSPRAARWAAVAGAAVVLVSSEPPSGSKAHAVIGSLAELPALLERR